MLGFPYRVRLIPLTFVCLEIVEWENGESAGVKKEF